MTNPSNFKTPRFDSPKYRAWIRNKRCSVPMCSGKSEPHHQKSRGAGGDDKDCVPLCEGLAGHHAEFHRIGRWTFSEKYGLDLKQEAARLWEEWRI